MISSHALGWINSVRCIPIYVLLLYVTNLFYIVHFQNHLSVSKMEVSAWLMEQAVTRGEWKCVSMGCGEL